MTVEWIGLATLVAGCLGLAAGRGWAIPLFLVSTLLGASSASILTALGGANLPPAHVMLGFLGLLALAPRWRGQVIAALAWPRPGFWLLLTVIYGVLAAIFMPRLLAGATYVFTFARTDYGTGLLLLPLAPVSGNITQTTYFVADLAAYALICALAGDARGRSLVTRGLIACAVADLAFAGLDYLTYFTGTADLLAFLRNAPYRMLDTAEVIGLKRLVGSFPEASAFAGATLCLFAFVLNLWLEEYPSRLVGPLALLLLAALVASTSTTAYGGAALYLAAIYAASLLRLILGAVTPTRLAFLAVTPIVLAVVACGVALHDPSADFVADALDRLVLRKGGTASALERASWNSQALVNFADSYGLGVGIGSARASNVVIAVLANLGLAGAITYAAFVATALTAPLLAPDPAARATREAAASACVALLIAGCLAGTTIDLGLTFFVCAALAAAPGPATPAPAPRRAGIPPPLAAPA